MYEALLGQVEPGVVMLRIADTSERAHCNAVVGEFLHAEDDV